MNAKFVLLGISLVFLTGAFGGKIKRLEPGMDRAQVVKLLGNPDGVRRHENVEALTYADRLMSGFKWSRADYVIVLVDGRVTEYGPGEIRSNNPNTGTFIFVPL